ncbi:MAG: glycosyl hydrolase family 98 [Bacteroidaceae bacterium]|nr:glycosyl hydrolase family 98 [Bacteroidaceae bacterium]
MKKTYLVLLLLTLCMAMNAQERRPIDSKHPMWLVHVDVWNKADPQKIINLIPDEIKPYVVLNLSLSCQYDTEKNVYKMPQNAVKTYKSWGTVCQANGMWFTCQPASGGHTHIQDDDLETFEYFYKRFPNFLGWNYAEQFWGFDEANDKSSSTQASRIALFAKLVPMAHKYGGFLTVSFCGNIWSHPLNPVGMMKRNSSLLNACKKYPEAMLWLYKYTTSSCFYNNESVTFSPFISGLAANYGVRYDNCGWNGALSSLLGEDHGKKYPIAAGIGTVMEQTAVNGGAVWDGPELIWTEDFQNLNNSTVDGFTRRNWGCFPGFKNAWLDMFQKIIDGAIYIPSREEVVKKTKIIVINDVSSGNDEQKYAAWGDLYDGLYKQTDPFNRGNGQWMDNFCYFKKTGRYGAIPVAIGVYDDLARAIPVQVKKSNYTSRWSSQTRKVNDFNNQYPEVSKGDLYVSRYRNQLITYTPYTYINSHKTATADIPLQYNTCDSLTLIWGKLSSGSVREYADHIDFYLNNYRTDTTSVVTDKIIIKGVTSEPSFKLKRRVQASGSASGSYVDSTQTYTILVRHMGPVDLTVNCSGDATDRLTDYLSDTSLSLDLPRQPEPYFGPITIEAEDMDYKSIKSCCTDPYGWYPNVFGHAGNGFMDMGTNTAGALRHNLSLAKGGNYQIAIKYCNASKAGSMKVVLGTQTLTAKIEKTGLNQWKKATVDVEMKEGNNQLTITNTSGIGLYIDNITYVPEGTEPELFGINIRQADHGTVTCSVDSAAEGETVTLNVEVEDGYKLTGWTVVHGGITVNADGTFIMPDDNVTLMPLFADLTAVYTLDYNGVLNGTLPPGWQCTQENSDVHSYPNSYSSGARTFVGFDGYQGAALYWRNDRAEYGRQSGYNLRLTAGSYRLTFAMAAWKGSPRYKVQILSTSGTVIAEAKQGTGYLATPNVNGSTSGSIKSATEYTLDFDIKTTGNYVISFQNTSSTGGGFTEFLLAECRINTVVPAGIEQIESDRVGIVGSEIYTISGTRSQTLQRGINIIRTSDGKTKKVLVK